MYYSVRLLFLYPRLITLIIAYVFFFFFKQFAKNRTVKTILTRFSDFDFYCERLMNFYIPSLMFNRKQLSRLDRLIFTGFLPPPPEVSFKQ